MNVTFFKGGLMLCPYPQTFYYCLTKTRVRAQTQSSENDLKGEQDTGALEGLKFLEEKEKEIRYRVESHKALELDQQGSKLIDTSIELTSAPEIDESDPQRTLYHKFAYINEYNKFGFFSRLFRAGMGGKSAEAEDIIREMIALGIQPGARAYHALVFAYAKAQSASGALNAIRRAHASGLNPLTESYLVLIHAFVKENNLKNAEAVFKSMRRPDANVDAEKGWIMLTSMLLQNGSHDKATTLLEEGKQEGFMPDAKLYALSIWHHCAQHNIEAALENLGEILIYQMHEQNTLNCTHDHTEPLLECFRATGNILMMIWLLSLPEAATILMYNSVLHAIIEKWDESGEDWNLVFDYVWDRLQSDDEVLENVESTLLYVLAEIKKGNALNAQKIFIKRQLADTKVEKEEQLVHEVLSRLLVSLSAQGLPIAMHNLLLMLSITNTAVPDEAFIPDIRGRTFVTQWLDNRLEDIKAELRPTTNVEEADEEDGITFTEDGRRVQIVYGIKIGFGRCVVDEQGTIVPLSKLRVSELRAECKARGLPMDGNRKELYHSIKFARRAMPSISDEIKRVKQLSRKQEKLSSHNRKRSSQTDSETSVEEATYHRCHYFRGKLIKTETLSEEEGIKILTRPGAAQAEEGVEEEGDESFESLMPGVDSAVLKWNDSYTLSARQKSDLGTNETASGNAVVGITELLWKLGGTPTLEDFETMMYVIDKTRNPAAAWKLGNLITIENIQIKSQKSDLDDAEEDHRKRVRRILHVCARLCLTCGFPDSCEQLVTSMKEFGLTPDTILLDEISQYREKGTTELEGKYPSKEIDNQPFGKELVPVMVDPLRTVRTETPPLEDEGEEKDESEIEEPRDPFATTKADDEDEDEDEDEDSLEGYGGLDRLKPDTTADEAESDDEEILTDAEI